MALSGKRILVTGGAGFIGTTLARQLVDQNTIVAYDNLHRDSLSGLDLASHPNFELIQGDILDAEHLREAAVTHLRGIDELFTSRYSGSELATLAELLSRLPTTGDACKSAAPPCS